MKKLILRKPFDVRAFYMGPAGDKLRAEGKEALIEGILQSLLNRGMVKTGPKAFKARPTTWSGRPWKTAEEKQEQRLKGLTRYKNWVESKGQFSSPESKTRALNKLDEKIAEVMDLSQFESDADIFARKNPQGLQLFDKKGQPKLWLKRLYRQLRGDAIVNKAGDLIGYNPNLNMYGDAGLLNKMYNTGALLGDTRSGTYVLPQAIVSKIDPQYKEYNKAMQELADIPVTEGVLQTRMRPRFGYLMNYTGLKNIPKSTDLKKAFNEVQDFLTDYRNSYGPADIFEEEASSLNKLRQFPEKINELELNKTIENKLLDDIREELALNAESRYHYVSSKDARKALKEMAPEELEKRRAAAEAIVKGPFTYLPEETAVSEKADWKLVPTRNDLKCIGKKLGHCYQGNDPYRFGDRIVENKIRLLHHPAGYTAEIVFSDPKRDAASSNYVTINQVRGKDNEDVTDNDKIMDSLYDSLGQYGFIIESETGDSPYDDGYEYARLNFDPLPGGYHLEMWYENNYSHNPYQEDTEWWRQWDQGLKDGMRDELDMIEEANDDEEAEQQISDIFTKHIIKAPSHLVSAVNRRF